MIKIMGILNVTPDSFFDQGRYTKLQDAIDQASKMIEEGAQILDIGGESSRPGAKPVSLEEEKKRVLPVLEEVRKRWPGQQISLDTTKAKIVQAALPIGIDYVNDISAGEMDPDMLPLMQDCQTHFVFMHMQGEPQTMQQNPEYSDVLTEIHSFFEEKIRLWCDEYRMSRDRLILDPGIGFGKSASHNYRILANLATFHIFQLPILIGVAMKSLLGGDVTERLPGSLALNVFAAANGARILRVHHVKETRLALEALQKLQTEMDEK